MISSATAIILSTAAALIIRQPSYLTPFVHGFPHASISHHRALRTTTPGRSSPLIPPSSRENRFECYYAEEWSDADIALSFTSGNNAQVRTSSQLFSPSQKISNRKLMKSILRQVTYQIYRLKEAIRLRIERWTIYVLECEDGKYYIGSTTHRKRRFQEHTSLRGGSKWTREHKPVRVLREYKRVASEYRLGLESKVTAECMLEFGVNNVRGAMFCAARQYNLGDVNALTGFLGHYNDLSYRKVSARLMRTLPPSPDGGGNHSRRRNNATGASLANVRCFSCRKMGHYASDCPEKERTN